MPLLGSLNSLPWKTLLFLGVLGAIIGSFLALCSNRIPSGQSIVTPASHCEQCKTLLAWYDLCPVVSYLLLGGRCRTCKANIAHESLLLELISAVWFVYLGLHSQTWYQFLHHALLGMFLLVISVIDIHHGIIPDRLSWGGVATGLLVSFLPYPYVNTVDCFSGAVLGYVLFLLIGTLYRITRRKDGLGGGDRKLLAMIGAFLGWQGVLIVVVLSSCLGIVGGLIFACYRKESLQSLVIPYGPFLATAAVLHLLVGNRLIGWYLTIIGW